MSRFSKKLSIILFLIFLLIVALVLFTIADRENEMERLQDLGPGNDKQMPGNGEKPQSENVISAIPSATDLRDVVLNTDRDVRIRLLTENQIDEMEATAITSFDFQPDNPTVFRVEWSEDPVFSEQASDYLRLLDGDAVFPVYKIRRPTESSMFQQVRQLSDKLGVPGAVARRSPTLYVVTDLQSGASPLEFSLNDQTFALYESDLQIVSTGTPDELVEVLKRFADGIPLIGFPFVSRVFEFSEDDTVWVRFSPVLQLDLLTFDTRQMPFTTKIDSNGSPIDFGVRGAVDFQLLREDTGGYRISSIHANFPNLEPISGDESLHADLHSKEFLDELLVDGRFERGTIELQYPGALSLDDKTRFLNYLSDSGTKSITDGVVEDIRCGYFFDGRHSLQVYLVPVCFVEGRGSAQGQDVVFRGVLPIIDAIWNSSQ